MTVDVKKTTGMTLALIRQGLDEALVQVEARLRAVAIGKAPDPFVPPPTSALPTLARIFHLNTAELELIALAGGYELEPAIGDAIHATEGPGALNAALAERLISPGIWDLLCPEAPLRRWRLIEIKNNGPMRERQMRLDERILHALLGTNYLDARLDGLVHRCALSGPDEPADRGVSDRLSNAWKGTDTLPVILLGGQDRLSKRAIAGTAARALGIQLFRMNAADIPGDWSQRTALAVLLDRELALSGAAILLEADKETSATAATLVNLLSGPVILAAEDPPLTDRTPRVRLELDPPDVAQRRDLWRTALGQRSDMLGDGLNRLAGQFSLDPPAITAAAMAASNPVQRSETILPAVWQAAKVQGRRALDGLAERIESRASWDDLVLPSELMAVLRDIEGHARDAWRVNQDWGWEARSPRGLGAAALFAGASGTGKTMAAEVLAGALNLDLYRIDLSQVVSKYIGETEKNLSRIFAAAEASGAILLFDEADALFGKRSEVKDSHDRYANVEVSFLLQRMEAYRGLAILTTNLKSALDGAFLRRLRYVLNFPFPDMAARAQIWARIFPEATPREALDYDTLARLNLSGGSIRSVALNAAYLAAAVPEPVQLKHIGKAARREYAKLEKPFTAAEQGAFR